tara:strand:+ start:805 stop:1773 length:969 start_codon:yes stop_codon:yes gene_type:complete
MNIKKITKNKKTYYINKKTRKNIKSKKILNHIHNLKIPPNYKNVKINHNINDKILAIGEDNAGRKQYIYNKKFTEKQKIQKFNNLLVFGKYISKIKKEIKFNLNSNKPIYNKDKIISIVLYLIDYCNFRVGNNEYKLKYNTYGTTTLKKDHIIFKKNEVEIKFIGKKHVENKSAIKNKNIINLLNTLCMYNKNKEYLFYYVNNNKLIPINSSHINSFIKKYDDRLTVKMFRTWNGNTILLNTLIKMDKPKDKKEIKKNIIYANKYVASCLHNTPMVSKKSYVNNIIYDLYINDNELFYRYVRLYYKNNIDTFFYKLLQKYYN